VSQHFRFSSVPESNLQIGFGESEGTSRFYCAKRNLCDLVAEREPMAIYSSGSAQDFHLFPS
jgi:hypothetical protein